MAEEQKPTRRLYSIDEGLNRICNWVVAVIDNDFSKVLKEDSYFVWNFKRERSQFEQEVKKNPFLRRMNKDGNLFFRDISSPFEIYRGRFAENSDDLIQNISENPDSLQWEGGWEGIEYNYSGNLLMHEKPVYGEARLELSAWEDYWGTREREVILNLREIRRIARGDVKKVITNCYENPDTEVGDARKVEEEREMEMKKYQFRRDMMKRFPDATCSREDMDKFYNEWEKEYGEIYSS